MSAKRKRKITIVSILLLVVVIGGTVAIKANGKDKKPPESPVKTAKTEIGDVQVKVTEVGTVEPEVKVEVKSAISGKVIEILHRDGDVVRRGVTRSATPARTLSVTPAAAAGAGSLSNGR